MSGFVDQFPHVRRQVALEAQSVASDGMNETENRRMERLAVEVEFLKDRPKPCVCASIDRISQ